MKKKRAVFTAVIGGYEEFIPHCYEVDESTDLICFTDVEAPSANGWNLVKVRPRFPNDPIRSSRFLKIMGPSILSGYQESLWLDNTVRLKVSPSLFLREYLHPFELVMPFHSYRDTVAAEYDECARTNVDDFTRIYEQYFHYANECPSVLQSKPFWSAIILRKHTQNVINSMTIWWEQVLRYSRRDQLSANYSIFVSGIKVGALEVDNFASHLHEWPVFTNRHERKRTVNGFFDAVSNVPLSRLAGLQNDNRQLKDRLLKINHQLNNYKDKLGNLFVITFEDLLRRGNARVVQIGACDGKINDPIYEVFSKYKEESSIILIEPQVAMIDELKKSYACHPNVHIVNCAVGDPGSISLYCLDPKYYKRFHPKHLLGAPIERIAAGFVSSIKQHVVNHVAPFLDPGISIDDAIKSIEVPSSPLRDILSRYQWSTFDLLQVDVEGMDDMVLRNCSIEIFKPRLIHYEHMHLGSDRQNALAAWLRSLGYVIIPYSYSDSMAIRN